MKRKTVLILLTMILVMLTICLACCDGDREFIVDNDIFSIQISSNGEIVETIKVDTGYLSSDSIKIRNDGHALVGLYENEDFSGDKIVFPYRTEKSATLYAKWEIIELEYTLNDDNQTYTVTGEGNAEGNIVIPDTYNDKKVVAVGSYSLGDAPDLTGLTIGKNVTSIDDSGLYSCINLTYINIPASLVSIDDRAFGNCFELEKFVVDDNNQFYTTIDGNLYSKDKMTFICYADGVDNNSFIIPEGVETIANTAFYNTAVTSVAFPETLIRIEDDAFQMSSLKSLVFPSSLEYIGVWSFAHMSDLEDVVFNEGLKYVMSGAFAYSRNIENVDIPASVLFFWDDSKGKPYYEGIEEGSNNPIPNLLGDPIFRGCEKLTNIEVSKDNECYTSIDGNLYSKDLVAIYQYCPGKIDEAFVLPSTVKHIASNAFTDASFQRVTIPEGIRSLEFRGFSSCRELTSIYLPKSLTYIGQYSFVYCTRLTNIEVHPDNPQYTSVDGDLYSKDMKTIIRYASGKTEEKFIIPSTITAVGGDCFSSSNNLIEVIIPNSVEFIGDSAFSQCEKLMKVTIGEGVTQIRSSAFLSCGALRSIVIPENVVFMGEHVFGNTSNLTIYCEATEQPEGWEKDWEIFQSYDRSIINWGYLEVK